MYLRSASGQLVPLTSIATITNSRSLNTLNQFVQQHSATLSDELAPGYTIDQVLSYLEGYVHHHFNAYIEYDFSGQSRQYTQSEDVLATAFVFAIILIYLLLAALIALLNRLW